MLDPTQCENLAASSVREPLSRFAYWLVQQLDLPHELHDGYCRVAIPEDKVEAVGESAVAFCLDKPRTTNGSGKPADGESPTEVRAVQLTADAPFFRWLCDQLRDRGVAVHARPCKDPLSVYELAEPLFKRYRVEEGRVHLSGCTLEDRPFMRLTYAAERNAQEVTQLFFTADGVPADVRTRDALGLSEVCTTRSPQPHAGELQVDLLLAAGRRCVQHLTSASDSIDFGVSGDPVAATIMWVKRAVGKLQFTISEESVELGFEGWARTLQAPPFVCPHSNVATFHVAATDDGRIAAAEAIEACAKSGKRVLTDELVTCSVTDQRVLPSFTRICPVSGKPALQEEFQTCSLCRQHVSRALVKGGVCEGCRSLAGVPGDDPRLVWILSEFPRLEQWKRWRLSETAGLYIAMGTRFSGHVLIVFDKETLSPRFAATRGRFRKTWFELDPTEQQEFFAERAMEKPE